MAVAMPRRALATVAALLAVAVAQIAAQSFEVASVKPSRVPSGPANALERMAALGTWRPLNGRLQVQGAHVITLLQQAYKVKEFQVRGAPPWTGTERYDLEAVAGQATVEQTRAMLRALLEERFALKVRRAPATMDVYELTAVRGSRLAPTRDGDCVSFNPDSGAPWPPLGTVLCGGFIRQIVNSFPDRLDRFEGAGVPMPELVDLIETEVGRRIVDRTGLTGLFTLKLEFAPNLAGFDTGPVIAQPSASVAPGLSIFTALQEQLGLRLVAARGSVDVLVVERVERPTPN